jgi:protease-4
MRVTRVRVYGSSLALLAGLGAAGLAHADPLPTSAEHVVSQGRSMVTDDTAEALVLNPANLAWLPAPEVRLDWVGCPDSAVKIGCGSALGLATPLFLGLSTSLRLDLVAPSVGDGTWGKGFPYAGYQYTWLSWGLAAHLGEHASIGFSFDHSYSNDAYLDSLNAITGGLSFRPNKHFAFSAVARNFNRPSQEVLPSLGTGGVATPVLDGQYTFGMALRPTGRRAFELGIEAKYWQGVDQWTERGTVGVDVPGFGRVFGGAEIANLGNDTHRGVIGTAGVELHWGGLSAGGGALFGSGLGSGSTVGEYGTIAFAGYTQPGIPNVPHAVWIRLESTPGTRGHVALLRRLWKLAEQPDVEAITLVLRSEPADSFAHAEELADALRVLRAHKKKVLCSFEDAGSRALYVCANADRIVVTPAGGVRYAGLRSQYIYLKGLLDKLGIKADMIRIGPHKTAPEQFTNEHAGPVAAQDHEDMLLQQEAVFVRNLSLYRHMTEDRIREETRKGPFVAEEAKQAGLVDGFAFDDEIEHATRELVGHEINYVEYQEETRAPSTFAGREKIGLLYLEGDIVDGRSQHIPLVDMRLVGSYSMQEQIKKLREDPSVRAVVLRIESPGGSSLASDVMWRELQVLAKAKPLIVSMGTVAASGGYYVASASKDIYALPLTVTGSIGVFYGKADLSGLLQKIGVTIDTYKTAPRADAESWYRPFTPEERTELEHKVDQFYDTFLTRVSTGRGMAKADIDAVGRGRVWTGQQAYERHLIDHLGGLREALADARAAGGMTDDAPIVEYPPSNASLVETLLKIAGLGGGEDRVQAALENLPPAVKGIAHALAPMLVYGQDEPLARIEWVEVPDGQ